MDETTSVLNGRESETRGQAMLFSAISTCAAEAVNPRLEQSSAAAVGGATALFLLAADAVE
jgi:hypothetical protein